MCQVRIFQLEGPIMSDLSCGECVILISQDERVPRNVSEEVGRRYQHQGSTL